MGGEDTLYDGQLGRLRDIAARQPTGLVGHLSVRTEPTGKIQQINNPQVPKGPRLLKEHP